MELGLDVFLYQIFEAMSGFGGLPFMMKISAIVLLLIASMKVSALKPLWDKLGPYKAFAAPAFSLIVGIISMVVDKPFSFAGLGAYLFAGAGAIIMHELLDALKAFPSIGAKYQGIISFFQGLLKKKA